MGLNSGKVGDLVVYDSLALLYSAPSLLSPRTQRFLPLTPSLGVRVIWFPKVIRSFPLFVGTSVALFRSLSARQSLYSALCRQSCPLIVAKTAMQTFCWQLCGFIPLFVGTSCRSIGFSVGTSSPLIVANTVMRALCRHVSRSFPLSVSTSAPLFPSLSRLSDLSTLDRHVRPSCESLSHGWRVLPYQENLQYRKSRTRVKGEIGSLFTL